jgi:hypothetical protein
MSQPDFKSLVFRRAALNPTPRILRRRSTDAAGYVGADPERSPTCVNIGGGDLSCQKLQTADHKDGAQSIKQREHAGGDNVVICILYTNL